MTERIAAIARADDRIRAVLLYGSHATGSADGFSDIDIGLVVADDAYDEVLARPGELAGTIGDPLLVEDFGEPANLHVILADGVDLELIVGRASELTLERPYRVLLDKDGLEEAARDRRPPPPPDIDTERVRQLVHWFWHDVGHVITALGRGHLLWAHGQLEELRGVCIGLARVESGMEIDDEPYWKIDAALPEERLAALRATVVAPEAGPMRDAALALVDLYRELAPAAAASHGIEYPTELDRILSDRLRTVAVDPPPASGG
jgi:predicted nucleotidyltransferase